MSERLTLQDLTDLLADKQGITKKDAEAFLRELIAVISENIEHNDSVKIKDFGTFKLVKVNSRKSVDVNTGEAIEIPAHYKLSFTPEKSLRDLLNAPFAHFESVVIEDGVDFEKIKFDAVPAASKDDTVNEEEIEVEEEVVVSAKVVEPIVTEVVDKEETQPENPKEVEENKLSEKVGEQARVQEVIEETVVEHVDETPLVPEEAPVLPVNKAKSVVAKVEDDVEEDDDDDDMAYLYEDNSKRKWLIITALFLAIIAISLYVYRDDFFGRDIVEVQEAVTPADDNSVVDSVAASAAKDTIPATKIEAQVEDKTASVDVKKDHKPKDVITLKTGDTLRKLALKYYGSKTFWVYIYQENQDKIPNFNNVQIGQKIVIPANEKYGIDISDSKSLAKAKALEEKYFK